MKKFILLLSLLILVGIISFVSAHECGDAGGQCVALPDNCPNEYSESDLSCAPAVSPRCCLPTQSFECFQQGHTCKSQIQGCDESYKEIDFECPANTICCKEINECEEAGNVCQLHSCPSHQERVFNLQCPYEASKGYICCRDKVYANIKQYLSVEPEIVEERDTIKVSIQLPSFRDCTYYITNPSGTEKQEGSGGCGPVGEIMTFSTYRLKELFGSIESGTYQIKVVAEKEDNPDITLTTEFKIGVTRPVIQKLCKIENGEGICEFLDMNYNIKSSGCDKEVDLEISYDGTTETFENLRQGISRRTLGNKISIKLNSAPCSVNFINLLFSKRVYAECGNKLCEIEEDITNCPQDCKREKEILMQEEPKDLSLECSVGCLYGTSCLSVGIRTGNEYCAIGNEFKEQKQAEESCINNFECESNLCLDDMCVKKGLFKKFLDWLKRLFG